MHRLWTHSILAILANPLMAALMQGKSDLFQGLLGTLPTDTIAQMTTNAQDHLIQLHQAALIRAEVSVAAVTFLMSAFKMGIIQAFDLMGPAQTPTMEQLAEALSDLVRRWLGPIQAPGESLVGKRIMAEWLATINASAPTRKPLKL